MGKRTLAVLLAGALVLQNGAYVAADVADTEIAQNQRGGGFLNRK